MYTFECIRSKCNWSLQAALKEEHRLVEITKYSGPHTCCPLGTDNSIVEFAAEEIEYLIRKQPILTVGELQDWWFEKFGFEHEASEMEEAKQEAVKKVYGDWDESFLSSDFSSSLTQKQTPPCLIVGLEHCGPGLLGRLVIKHAYDEPDTFIKVEKKVSPEVVYNHRYDTKMVTVGASHGWVATLKDEDGILRLQDDLIPVASESDPRRIPLPPLVTLRHCQTQIVTNVSKSSSSPEEDDNCIVAVKFLGSQLSFCRPGLRNKAEWTNVKIENLCFYSSRVMFSKKDDTFRIPGSGGHLMGSWDPREHEPIIKIQKMRFENLPELNKTTRELLDSCFTSQHLVDSPSTGETFMVKQYKKTTDEIGVAIMKTEFVMVFKIDDEGNAVYTQDIGDLVIFISNSEPFCVPASSFPGLYSNSVHVLDSGEWVVVHLAGDNDPFIFSLKVKNWTPYYIPPQNID